MAVLIGVQNLFKCVSWFRIDSLERGELRKKKLSAQVLFIL